MDAVKLCSLCEGSGRSNAFGAACQVCRGTGKISTKAWLGESAPEPKQRRTAHRYARTPAPVAVVRALPAIAPTVRTPVAMINAAIRRCGVEPLDTGNDFWFRPLREQHTGEYAWVEPLKTFLRRRIWLRPDNRPPLSEKSGCRKVGVV